MTREDFINQRATTCRHGGHCEWIACDKCSHYEPDVLNQQPCEDDVSKFISRQVSLLEERMSSATSEGRWAEEEKCQCAIENLELVDEYIKAHPPVTPKEKIGKWIVHPIYAHLVCSKCLSGAPYNYKTNFCPNCGARMVEPQESEDKE